MPHFGGIFLQKINKTIFLITIVLVLLFCFTAVSANDEASIIGDSSSTDDIAVADVAVDASGDAQTIDNDVSYEADGIIVNDTGDSDKNTKTVLGSGLLAEGESNSFTNLANTIENAGSDLRCQCRNPCGKRKRPAVSGRQFQGEGNGSHPACRRSRWRRPERSS